MKLKDFLYHFFITSKGGISITISKIIFVCLYIPVREFSDFRHHLNYTLISYYDGNMEETLTF